MIQDRYKSDGGIKHEITIFKSRKTKEFCNSKS